MASSLHSHPIIFAAIFFFFFSFVISVSSSEPLFLSLTHSLSNSQFNTTPHHLLKSASSRSVARFLQHRNRNHLHRLAQVSLPLSSGSDYTLSLTLHSQPITLYMDTGSDVVWSPCAPFTCILCEGKPIPNPISITASLAFDVPCKSPACTAVHSSQSSSDLCAIARCPLDSIETSDCTAFPCPHFYYAYGDGSFVASLKTAVVSLPTSSPQPLALHNFTFGCAHTTLAEPIGVAGFGRGPLSLPGQLAKSLPQLGNQFSYCLVPHSFNVDRARRPSPLILGRHDSKEKDSSTDSKPEFVYTPMLDNPASPYFYSVGLEGITVGRRTIPAPETLRRIDARGDGGVVVDSGTTFTILPSGLFRSVVAEFERQLGRAHPRATNVEEKTGLSPCFYMSGGDVGVNVPDVALRFVGAGAGVVLPRENYFYEFVDGGDRRKVGCVMLVDGGDEQEMGGGPGATLGNYQQQGFEVVYDLEGRRVGFARRQCASLWETLRQH